MKNFIYILTAFIACLLYTVPMSAENGRTQKFKDSVYENTAPKPNYRATELGLSVGIIPYSTLSTTGDGKITTGTSNIIVGLDVVFGNAYVGLYGGEIHQNGAFIPRIGYAFRLNFFDGKLPFDAVVAPYLGMTLSNGYATLTYGAHTIFRASQVVGVAFDMNPSYCSLGLSFAF